MMSFEALVFILMISNLSSFSFIAHGFCVISKKFLPDPKSQTFFSYILLQNLYNFSSYILVSVPFLVHFSIWYIWKFFYM